MNVEFQTSSLLFKRCSGVSGVELWLARVLNFEKCIAGDSACARG